MEGPTAWLQGLDDDDTEFHHLDLNEDATKRVNYHEADPSEDLDCGNEVDVYILSAASEGDQPNAGSIVLAVTHGQTDFLLMGDALHNGANNATSKEWVEKVKPHIAIVSASDHRGFYHLQKAVITRLETWRDLETTVPHSLTSSGKEGGKKVFSTNGSYTKGVYNTHDSGTIYIASDGASYTVFREK